jgi:protein KRI1
MSIRIVKEEERRAAATRPTKTREKGKEKPILLRDYQRRAFLNGTLDGDDDEAKKPKVRTHDEETEDLRAEVTAAFHAAADGDTGEEGGEDDGFLVQREKTVQEIDDEDEEYRRFLIESVGEKEIDEALRIARVVGEGGSTGETKSKKHKKSEKNEDEDFLRE